MLDRSGHSSLVDLAQQLMHLQGQSEVVRKLLMWTRDSIEADSISFQVAGPKGFDRCSIGPDDTLEKIPADEQDLQCDTGSESRVGSSHDFRIALDLGKRSWGMLEVKGYSIPTTEEMEILRSACKLTAEALRNAYVFDRLKRRVKGVTSLYKVGRTISSSLDLRHLLELILSSLREVVQYDAAGIYLLDEKGWRFEATALRGYRPEMEGAAIAKLGQGIIGWAAKKEEDVLVKDVSENPHYLVAREETRSEMVALLRRGQRILGAFNLESDVLNAYSRTDLMLLKAFASQAAVAVDNAMLYKDALEKRRLDQELSLARSIQERLLPSAAPHVEGWEIAGLNVPANSVGGDYYDFIELADGVQGICIADVVGKGVPAGLVMATFRATLLAEIFNEYSIETIFEKVNQLLVRSTDPSVFVTAIYGALETEKGAFTYCNAGHMEPLLIPLEGEPTALVGSDLVLGLFPEVNYHQRITKLQKGDILLLYTDGISEATGSHGDEFGIDRMVAIAQQFKDRPAVEIRDRIYAEVLGFAADPTVLDDITAVVVKRLGNTANR